MLDFSQRAKLAEPDSFFWATGIEDTFITSPFPKTGRTLDEYELTQHYSQWATDLELMRELGVRAARYGIPWHRLQPTPRTWDWSFADASLEALLDKGIDPIVDLVHYGLPEWIEYAYLNPDFPRYMAEYAARLAERFRGRIHAYTPLNEPRITSWYCGKLGWWPPFQRGWGGFVKVMLSVCRGIVTTVKALRSVDSDILCAHVDATDLYESPDPALAQEASRRQEMVFLALDLISGRIDSRHQFFDWLQRFGAKAEDLDWFREHAVDLPMLGINLYPMFSQKVLVRQNGLRIRMPYTDETLIERLSELYWQRYGAPMFISETASMGSVRRRSAWLKTSIQAVRRVRKQGIPLVGYTWWPMFALVTWAYRQGNHPPAYYLKQMGLWDLVADSASNLQRVRTPLVDEFQALVSGGANSVGQVKAPNQGRKHVPELLLRGI
jgi:beta-glucosidase